MLSSKTFWNLYFLNMVCDRFNLKNPKMDITRSNGEQLVINTENCGTIYFSIQDNRTAYIIIYFNNAVYKEYVEYREFINIVYNGLPLGKNASIYLYVMDKEGTLHGKPFDGLDYVNLPVADEELKIRHLTNDESSTYIATLWVYKQGQYFKDGLQKLVRTVFNLFKTNKKIQQRIKHIRKCKRRSYAKAITRDRYSKQKKTSRKVSSKYLDAYVRQYYEKLGVNKQISGRIVNALHSCDIYTLKQFVKNPNVPIYLVPGIGDKTIDMFNMLKSDIVRFKATLSN